MGVYVDDNNFLITEIKSFPLQFDLPNNVYSN